jgi:hypothetical protein
MKHMPVVSLVLLFGSMTAAAQSFGPGSIQTTVLNAVPPSSDCPIGMRVQHGNGDQLLWAKDRPVGIAQYLQVIMSNSKSVDIVGAKITVYGFAAKTRYIPAQSPRTSSPDLTKTVGLDLMVKSKGGQSTDLRLPHFTAVSWVDLDSVTYADGTTWHSSVGKTCHVVPELMRLVSSR